MIAGTHPVVQLLAAHPTFAFHLVGSRLLDRNHSASADYDYLLGTEHARFSKEYRETIKDWFESAGFKPVEAPGCSGDTLVYNHFRWTDPKGVQPHVDVLVMSNDEVTRRMVAGVLRDGARMPKPKALIQGLKRAWPGFWELTLSMEQDAVKRAKGQSDG